MVQTKRKTNVVALAIVLSLVFVFALVAVLFDTPATETAYAIDNVAQFHFYGLSNYGGSKTDGGITFSYSGNYYIPGGTSCIVLEAGGSFTVTVSNAALNNKNINKVKYTLTDDYASGAGEGAVSVRLKRGTSQKSTSMQTSSNGVDITGSGDLTFTITNKSTSDRSKAYRFSTNFTLMAPSQVAVTVSAGTGVKEVFLSSAQSGSPVAASGSKFAENTTVYAFAKLAKGYQAQSGWGLVSGNANSEDAVYRTGSKKITTSSKDFGTINAALKTRTIALNGNGIENDTSITLVYDQANSAGALVRSGYNFLGWNTNAEGTGATYGNSEGASLSVEQVNAILDDASITAFYAMWKADKNTVIAYINAIGEVEYTQACKDKIDAARTLYDSLDTADKAQVTNYGILTDAEATYNAMHADKLALDAYKTEKKTDADDLALEGDSAACTDLISDAKDAIDALSYDCTKSLDENKAAVDAIVSDLVNALTLQRDKDAFEVYKTPKKADADSLAREGDSAACEGLIAVAKAEIEDLDYDEDKTLAENKTVIDGIITALESALYNQRVADEVADYIDEIDDSVTLASKAGIDTARALYDGLSANQKSLVGNYNKLTDAEAAYAEVLANCEAKIGDVYYENLDDAYDAVVENGTITINKNFSIADRGTPDPYINVTKDLTLDLDGHTLMIGQGAICVIDGAVLSIKNTKPATGGIKGGAGVDPSSGAYVLIFDSRLVLDAATVKEYAIINRIAKGYLVEDINGGEPDENGYYSIVRPITAADVIASIDAIGTVVYTDDCKAKIDEASVLYEDMDEANHGDVTNYDKLTDAKIAYAALKADNDAADAVDALIDAIEVPVTLAEEDAIVAAKEAFDALTSAQKDLVINEEKLFDAIIALVEAYINAIPDPVVYTTACGDKIAKARDFFDELTEAEQALVENKQDLLDAEAAYKALDDVAKANAAKALIEAIGEVEDTQSSKNAIDAAREAYDALTDDQKALIAEDVPTITTAETTYTTLHANNLAAAEVIALIEAVGTVEYTDTSKNKIDTAKEAYNDLTDAQKAIVDGYLTENEVDTIVVSETIYIGLGDQQKAQEVKDLIVAIGEVKYPDSKDKIEAARGSYDALTDTQKALVDNYSVLTTAEATYAKLEVKANKKLSGGAIAGIVIGCVAFVACVGFLLWFFLFKKKKEDKDEPKVAVPETNDEPKDDLIDEQKE